MFKPKRLDKISHALLLALITLGLITATIPGAFAWDIYATPSTRSVLPGGTTTFTIHVTGTIPGNPNVQLLVSPPVLGISASFTTNNVPAPFTSTMVVNVAASKAPGTYEIPVWAHPEGELFPGPGNRATSVYVVVGGPFDFSITLSPPSITVKQGETARFQIILTYSDPSYSGTTITVQVTGLGPGMTYQLVPSPPSLAIFTSKSTPTGTYPITLIGSAMGVTHQTTAILIVTPEQPPPPPFDFAVEPTLGSQSVKAGETATFTINVRLISGTAEAVTLSLIGNPDYSTYTFNPSSGNPSFSSSLRISTSTSTPPGTYALTITGQDGDITRSAIVELFVEKAKSESSISISLSPPTLRVGETLSIAGVLSPGVAAEIEIIYRRPDGFELTKHVTASSSGAFSDSFAPDAEGVWSAYARWAGNEELEPSESPPATFTVEPPAPIPTAILEQIPGGLTTLVAVIAIALIALAAISLSRRGERRAAAGIPTRKCSRCGAESPAGSAYCPSCGEKLQ